jgi:ligand-binding sensor domain-containing protein
MLPVLFAGSIFFQPAAFAQWTIFNDANSPLPQNTVRCIAIDSQNRKWIGTDFGLAVYNDISWTVYTTSNTSGGLTDNGIRCITFDNAGNTWLGTFNGGIVKFDGTNWSSYTTINSGVPDNFVKSIAFDTAGVMWVCTPGGLTKYDWNTWQVWDINNTPTLLSHHFTCVVIGANNMKYLGTLNGGMVYFDGDTTWEFYNHVNSLLPDNTVLSIALDSSGTRWAAMPAQGIIRHVVNLVFQWYNITNSLIPSSAIVHIMIDSLQTKYLSSQNEGFIIFDGANFVNYKTTNSPMPDDYVNCTAKDHNGILWVGTYNGGLVRVDEALLGMENAEAEILSVSIYPNPVSKELRIQNSEFRINGIEIYDATGHKVFNSAFLILHSAFAVDISQLTPGIYFLRIFSDGGIVTKKFVKTN